MQSLAAKVYFYGRSGVTFFHLWKPDPSDPNRAKFVFDGPATAEQIEEYASEYAKFLACELIGEERTS